MSLEPLDDLVKDHEDKRDSPIAKHQHWMYCPCSLADEIRKKKGIVRSIDAVDVAYGF